MHRGALLSRLLVTLGRPIKGLRPALLSPLLLSWGVRTGFCGGGRLCSTSLPSPGPVALLLQQRNLALFFFPFLFL